MRKLCALLLLICLLPATAQAVVITRLDMPGEPVYLVREEDEALLIGTGARGHAGSLFLQLRDMGAPALAQVLCPSASSQQVGGLCLLLPALDIGAVWIAPPAQGDLLSCYEYVQMLAGKMPLPISALEDETGGTLGAVRWQMQGQTVSLWLEDTPLPYDTLEAGQSLFASGGDIHLLGIR